MVKKSNNLPPFNDKRHIKMTDLAEELGMHYNSLFAKQKLIDVWSIKALDGDKEVAVFTNESAKIIRSSTAPKMTDKDLELVELEGRLGVNRGVLLRILGDLKIVPERKRRSDNKTVPTIPMKHEAAIAKEIAVSAKAVAPKVAPKAVAKAAPRAAKVTKVTKAAKPKKVKAAPKLADSSDTAVIEAAPVVTAPAAEVMCVVCGKPVPAGDLEKMTDLFKDHPAHPDCLKLFADVEKFLDFVKNKK